MLRKTFADQRKKLQGYNNNFLWHDCFGNNYEFLERGGFGNKPENILLKPDLDNASVGKREIIAALVKTRVVIF